MISVCRSSDLWLGKFHKSGVTALCVPRPGQPPSHTMCGLCSVSVQTCLKSWQPRTISCHDEQDLLWQNFNFKFVASLINVIDSVYGWGYEDVGL